MAKCRHDPCRPPSSPPLYRPSRCWRSRWRCWRRGTPGRRRRPPRRRAGPAGGELFGLEGHLPGRRPAAGDVQDGGLPDGHLRPRLGLRRPQPDRPWHRPHRGRAGPGGGAGDPRWAARSSSSPTWSRWCTAPGYQRATSDNHSWRAECGWRGFFDVDPMTPDYREGVVLAGLRMLKAVHDAPGARRDPRGDAGALRPGRRADELGGRVPRSLGQAAARRPGRSASGWGWTGGCCCRTTSATT